MRYKQLNATHPLYDGRFLEKYRLLYEGGEEILKSQNAAIFITARAGETNVHYQDRLNQATYKNYMAEIVNDFVATLFSKQLMIAANNPASNKEDIDITIPSFYNEFWTDADRCGNPLDKVIRGTFCDALVYKVGYIGVDFPYSEGTPQSLLDEEAAGTDRAYLVPIDPSSVIDWEENAFGEFKWVVLRREEVSRDGLEGTRDTKRIVFKTWKVDALSGEVSWAEWAFSCKTHREPAKEEEGELISSGTVSFKRIPVLKLKCSTELYVGGLIGPSVANIFSRTSGLIAAENKNLHPTLVFKEGPEVGADKAISELAMDTSRGGRASRAAEQRGAVRIAFSDELDYVEPSGNSYEIVYKQIQDEIDEIHRISHTMANSITTTSKASAASGISKAHDNLTKETVLNAYAEMLKAFLKVLYDTVAEGRNEAPFDWRFIGMDNFRVVDAEQTYKEATDLLAINVPSADFKILQYMTAVQLLMPNLDAAALEAIKVQVAAGVVKEETKRELEASLPKLVRTGNEKAMNTKSRAVTKTAPRRNPNE